MKKILFFITIFVMIIAFIPNVYAADDETKVNGNSCSIENAIEQVKTTGGTIELQKDIVLEKIIDISVDNPITINLNGRNISCNQVATNFIIRKGEVKFTGNGKIQNSQPKNKAGTLYVKGSNNEVDKNYTHLIIDKNVSVEGPNPLVIDSYSTEPEYNNCYGAVVDIYGSIINNLSGSASPTVISINAKLKDINNAPIINIHDGAIIKNTIEAGVGIYLFGYANINVEKATIEAHTGIFATSGSINLEGTTIKANGQVDYKEKYGAGTGITGAAIQIESNPKYKGNVEVNIDGGNYTSECNSAIVEYSNGATETSVKEIKISDGEFKSAKGQDAIKTSDSFKEKNKEFITGGNFLSGDEKSNVSQYVKDGLLQDEDGTVINPSTIKPNVTDTEKNDIPQAGDNTSKNGVPQGGDSTGKDDTPKTGVEDSQVSDNIGLYIVLAVVSLTGLGLATEKFLKNRN